MMGKAYGIYVKLYVLSITETPTLVCSIATNLCMCAGFWWKVSKEMRSIQVCQTNNFSPKWMPCYRSNLNQAQLKKNIDNTHWKAILHERKVTWWIGSRNTAQGGVASPKSNSWGTGSPTALPRYGNSNYTPTLQNPVAFWVSIQQHRLVTRPQSCRAAILRVHTVLAELLRVQATITTAARDRDPVLRQEDQAKPDSKDFGKRIQALT